MNTTGLSAKYKHKTLYPTLNSAIWSVSHDLLPVPVPPHDRLASVEGDKNNG